MDIGEVDGQWTGGWIGKQMDGWTLDRRALGRWVGGLQVDEWINGFED